MTGVQTCALPILTNKALAKIMSTPFDLLLGRRTYEIFAAYWPYNNNAIGEMFNRINKYVVATTPVDLSWKNSTLIHKNVVKELKKLNAILGTVLTRSVKDRLVDLSLRKRAG